MALTTTDRVKGALRIPAGVTVSDARVAEIVAEVESDLLQMLDLTAWDAATVYTDRLDVDPGGAAQVVMLRRIPVTSVVALTVSGIRLVQDEDYYLGRGGAIRLIPAGAAFDAARQDVVCTYTAGHVTAGATPSWLARWATIAAARQYNQEAMSGLSVLDVDPVRREVARVGFDEDAADRELARLRARWAKPAG